MPIRIQNFRQFKPVKTKKKPQLTTYYQILGQLGITGPESSLLDIHIERIFLDIMGVV